jgi:DNA-binding MarR family transcriptional regulator
MGNPRSIKFLASILVIMVFVIPSVLAGESSIVGEVTEAGTGNPIPGANVLLFLSGSETLMNETTTDMDGHYEFTGLTGGEYTVKIIAQGFINQSHDVDVGEGTFGGEDTIALNVQMNPSLGGGGGGGEEPVEEEDSDFPMSIFTQMFMIVTIALIISIVMYSKIKKENLLKNAQRKRIMDYITENPGIHYRAILTGLDIPMGSLTYHLNRLEKAQFIRSRQDGMYRRFYVKSTRTEMKFFLSDIQESILQVINENQGISQSKIANKINVSRKVVNYHVNILDQAGLIFIESRGRESACFIRGPKSTVKAE